MYFVTTLVVSATLCCALAQQDGYPTQYFYLNPNNAASLAPAQYPTHDLVQPRQLRPNNGATDDDEELEASQFHSQDGDGRFAFGYSMPDQVRIESRNIDGSVRGSYSYLDPAGKTIKVQYWDDGSGFHSSGNNLPTEIPQQVQDTPEVQEARAQHFRLYQEALERAAASLSHARAQAHQRQQPLEMGDAEEGIVVESDSHTPVDEKGIELTRYPKLQIPQNLFDPAQVHDAKLEAVIVENPEILGPSFDGNSVRAGKSDAHFTPANTDQPRTPLHLVSKPRKGFSYSFSYPIPPTPVQQDPIYTHPGSQYGYMGLRSSKGLVSVMNPTGASSLHNKEIPFSYTFPVVPTVESASPVHQGIQQDQSSAIENQPQTFIPRARKGFSYSFTYPVKAQPIENSQYGSQYGYKIMRYVRSTDGIQIPKDVVEKKEEVGPAKDKDVSSRAGSTYIEVKPVVEYHHGYQASFPHETDELKSLFARMGNNPLGLSQKAVNHGSIPIAAVHDAQVAPYQQGTFKNHQLAPVFYGSFQKQDSNYGGSDGRGDIVSGLTKIPPVSVSEKAAFFGAIPVAAVHDQQVAPHQRDSIRDHQTLPLYIEHVAY